MYIKRKTGYTKVMSVKKYILFLITFVIIFLLAIYPSFISSPGVDCLAGCTIGKGFPLPYNVTHIGGIADILPTTEIRYQALAIDTAFVFIVSLFVSFILGRLLYRGKTD
jgi:hypothetical protein